MEELVKDYVCNNCSQKPCYISEYLYKNGLFGCLSLEWADDSLFQEPKWEKYKKKFGNV